MDIAHIEGTILFICAFLNLIMVLIFWFKGKSRATFHLGWTALFSAAYCFVFGGGYVFGPKVFWARACWIGVLIFPAYFTFIYYFIGKAKYIKLKSFLWYLGAIIIFVLALVTPYFSVSTDPEYPWTSEKGFLDPPLVESILLFV